MPNYYTHLTFGARVLERLPETLAAALAREGEAFRLGCLGPDPLFFDFCRQGREVRREGHAMHGASALTAAARLRRAVEEDVPMSRGYAAGFLCHLALDSACHGYVNRRAAEGGPTHLAMEAEFDRVLMMADGWPAVDRQAHMPVVEDPQVWIAAARAYVHAGPAEVERAYRRMERDTAMLARASDRLRGRLLDLVARLIPRAAGLRGIALRAEPDPACAESSRMLRRLLEEAVEPTAGVVAGFFEDVARGRPLSPWFDRDFKGHVFSGAAAEPALAATKK